MGLTSGGTFWTASPNRDPKRAFRFKVEIGESGTIWYAKTANRPSVTFAETTHNFMNHTYYWPGKASWNEVVVTFIDPVDPDLGGNLMQAVADSGYTIPVGTNNMTSMSKKSVMESLGGAGNDIRIHVIDEEGKQLETWSLKHAWITNINFSDLDYGSDEMSEISVTFRYDWATFASENGTTIFGEPV
tara:strand:- start:273 stop:836 length:564 start_codon:yes stop_codon:yes gene_type:complete